MVCCRRDRLRGAARLEAWSSPLLAWFCACSASLASAAGFFSDAQAARGEALYQAHCSTCHGAQLEGRGSVPLAGVPFQVRWGHANLSVDDLLYIVSTQMPYGSPGSLSRSQYLDIVCHILKTNRYPGGGEELPLDRAVLSARKLGRQPADFEEDR